MSVTAILIQCKWLLETTHLRDSFVEDGQSSRTKRFFTKLWSRLRGRKWVAGQAVIMSVAAFVESFFKLDVSGWFNVVQILCLLNGCIGYLWVYSFHEAKLAPLVDDLIWVSTNLEPLSTQATLRKCQRIVQFAKLVFWGFLIFALLLGAMMVIEPPLRSAFPVGHPFPKEADVPLPLELIIVTVWIWESCLLYAMGLTSAYMDGLHCSGLLVITSLLKMAREAITRCDFANDPLTGRTLITGHQRLLKVAQRCNKLMGTTVFIVLTNSFVVGLTTCYTVLAARSSPAVFVSFTIAMGTSTFLAMISEILMEANEEIGEAIYKSDWTSSLFSCQGAKMSLHLTNLKLTMTMVQMRALRPLGVESRFIGGVGNAFMYKYYQRLYTCAQALLKLL